MKLKDIINEIKVNNPTIPSEIEFIVDLGPIRLRTQYEENFDTREEWVQYLKRIKTDKQFAIDSIFNDLSSFDVETSIFDSDQDKWKITFK